jgi:hypothetical protein
MLPHGFKVKAADVGDYTFQFFAGREEAVSSALKSLSTMGIQEVGAVYASARSTTLPPGS